MFYVQIRKVEADTKATPTPDKQFPNPVAIQAYYHEDVFAVVNMC